MTDRSPEAAPAARSAQQQPEPATRSIAPAPPRVAVLLSERLATAGAGLDLPALQGWIEATLPNVAVAVVPDPAARPAALPGHIAASRAARVVLGLDTGVYPVAEVQTQVRKAGLDPLGVAVLDLGAPAALAFPRPIATARARALIAGAVARARAFPGTRPEHVKTAVSVAVSRRALFTLAVHEQHVVPAIRAARCVADRGCRICIDVCPRQALRLKDRRIEVDKTRCESCGMCAHACPTEAVELPGLAAAELEAQVAALLAPAAKDLAPRGILLACERSATTLAAAVAGGFRYPAGWLPVVVPCAGMLSPTLMLRCLALGAAAVGILGCREQCVFGQGDTVAERVAFCQALLEKLGGASERVRFCPPGGAEPAAWALPDGVPAAPAGAEDDRSRGVAAALLALARAHAAPDDLVVEHAQVPLGIVDIDTAGCTTCEACATVCPTGALASERGADGIAITFDPTLCPACGLCAPRCPEAEHGVLRLRRAIDLRRLGAGRVVLRRDETPRCVACGRPIAPAAMMARLAAMLGDEYAALSPVLTRLCSDCRGGAPVPR
ncbi:MAG: 4Fe-4S binding protein [Chloroflexi bacterium]|nr:4Fe-4S binding protein [Chloroflexota bacterium]